MRKPHRLMLGRLAPRNVSRLLIPLAIGCSGPDSPPRPPPGDSAISVVDADGRSIRLERPAERIVSLVPSATLTLAALGAASAVVARTDFDTVAWVMDRPSVGGGLQPSIEAIVAARPDLVVRFGGPQDTRTPERLDGLGIAHAALRPDGIADVLESIRLLGRLTGRATVADSLATGLAARLEGIRARSSGGPAIRVAYLLGGEPPWVAGPGTYIHELIELAGGTNVFADLPTLYSSVSPEEIVARDIDVILVGRGEPLPERMTRGARVVELGVDLELPGPGVADAAQEVVRALRGGLGGPGR